MAQIDESKLTHIFDGIVEYHIDDFEIVDSIISFIDDQKELDDDSLQVLNDCFWELL